MRQNKFSQQILSESDLINLYLTDPTRIIKHGLVDQSISFDEELELDNIPKLIQYELPAVTVGEFDDMNQNDWFIPAEYDTIDIAKLVLDLCTTSEELQRAGDELIKFQEREMFPLLRYLKYLVDTMRANNVVWGVGRGSSVASYVLYLLGVHRINSLHYDLSIDEFLK
jgi:DNA polymerase III alpha subunit